MRQPPHFLPHAKSTRTEVDASSKNPYGRPGPQCRRRSEEMGVIMADRRTLRRTAQRYRRSTRKQNARIVDEFVETHECTRNHASWLLCAAAGARSLPHQADHPPTVSGADPDLHRVAGCHGGSDGCRSGRPRWRRRWRRACLYAGAHRPRHAVDRATRRAEQAPEMGIPGTPFGALVAALRVGRRPHRLWRRIHQRSPGSVLLPGKIDFSRS